MLRWTTIGALAWLWVLGAGCGDDDGVKVSDITGKNPSNTGTAASGRSESIASGGGNTGTGTSGSGAAGNGSAGNDNGSAGNDSGNADSGNAGSGNAGVGGADDAGTGGVGGALAGSGGLGGIPGTGGTGTGQCTLVCPLGTHCALADVTCIQAPCHPVPQCVANTGNGGAGGGAGGAICGTRGSRPCPDGQFCNHPIGADCGRADEPGSCEQIPSGCTRDYQPVCGCDGNTYGNACVAGSAGVSVDRDGEC